MAYSTIANVVSEFKNITFGTTGKVTDTEVTDLIAQSDAEIDGRLAGVYTVPITGTTSLLIMKQLSIWLTKDRINGILAVKDGNDADDQKGDETLGIKARKMLTDIMNRVIDLPDATLAVANDGVSDYNSANSIEQIFQRDTTQW